MEKDLLFILLALPYAMVVAKRMPALIAGFRYQSFLLFLITLIASVKEKSAGLFVVSGLLFFLKVIGIPYFLSRMVRRIKANENLGLFMNTQLSLVSALGMTYLSWGFVKFAFSTADAGHVLLLTVSFSVVLMGFFLMIFRMKALAQIIGLLIMENGLFLLASSIPGGMPFFVEIAIFFDVFISVIILGVFVYRINKLFTHIDVSKLSELKG